MGPKRKRTCSTPAGMASQTIALLHDAQQVKISRLLRIPVVCAFLIRGRYFNPGTTPIPLDRSPVKKVLAIAIPLRCRLSTWSMGGEPYARAGRNERLPSRPLQFFSSLLAPASTAPAQTESAGIRGSVADPSGALVPEATVRLIDADRGIRDSNGHRKRWLLHLRHHSSRPLPHRSREERIQTRPSDGNHRQCPQTIWSRISDSR